jgi:CTP:molybdopterin cytidylyltransferase MocA
MASVCLRRRAAVISLPRPDCRATLRQAQEAVMHSRVSLLVMTGVGDGDQVEQMMAGARKAITLDLVDRALAAGVFRQIIVSTNSSRLAAALADRPVQLVVDPPGETFHFGRRLAQLVDRFHIEKLFYMGGGSGPLLSPAEMTRMVETVDQEDEFLVTNNFYSTDYAIFSPAAALRAIEPPALDNDLGWLLVRQAGLKNYSPPPSATTQLDVDTPIDLMTIQGHPDVGPHLARYLHRLNLDTSHIRQAMAFFVDRAAEVFVAGRVSSATWAYLERETACRVRLLSEERGMRASGRQARGEARSLLGFYLDAVGVEAFFARLAELGQAAFIDNRVVLAHWRLWPSNADRFYADLRQPDKIEEPKLRALVEAALAAPIPVVMGGHSLVSGGLYALLETAWATSGVDLPYQTEPLVWT